eukprot:403345890
MCKKRTKYPFNALRQSLKIQITQKQHNLKSIIKYAQIERYIIIIACQNEVAGDAKLILPVGQNKSKIVQNVQNIPLRKENIVRALYI